MKNENKNLLIIISIVVVILLAQQGFFGRMYIVGQTKFTYTKNYDSPSLKIGDLEFTSSPLQFHCQNQYSSGVSVGRTPDSCWSTTVSYEGEDYQMFANDKVQLNQYLEVQFKPTGKVRYGCYGSGEGEVCLNGEFRRETDWSNIFIFNITDRTFLTSEVADDTYEILLNSEKKIPLKIEQKLAPNIRGGVWTKTTNKMLFREQTSNTFFNIDKGTNTYEEVLIPTDFLGKIEIERKPFIIINNNVKDIRLMDNAPTIIEYKVVKVLTERTECLDSKEICCEDGIVRRKCDADRLGLEEGLNCEGTTDYEIGDYPITGEDETLIEEGDWVSKNTVFLIFGVLIFFIIVYFVKRK